MLRSGAKLAIVVTLMSSLPLTASAQEASLDVAYHDGALSVHCENAPLQDVFTRLGTEAGIDVTLRTSVAERCRKTDIRDQPLPHAIERLLGDHGLSYVLVLDRRQDVIALKVFRSGRRTPVRRAPGPRPPVFFRRRPVR